MREKLVSLDGAIDDLGAYGREIFVKTFKAHEKETMLKVVDGPRTPHTMVLEFAITAFVPTRAELEVVGTVGSFVCPIPGVGFVADYLASGSIAVECRARSSDTGESEPYVAVARAEGSQKVALTACVVGMLFVPPLYVFFRRLAGVKG